jgi:hypothetical protein
MSRRLRLKDTMCKLSTGIGQGRKPLLKKCW